MVQLADWLKSATRLHPRKDKNWPHLSSSVWFTARSDAMSKILPKPPRHESRVNNAFAPRLKLTQLLSCIVVFRNVTDGGQLRTLIAPNGQTIRPTEKSPCDRKAPNSFARSVYFDPRLAHPRCMVLKYDPEGNAISPEPTASSIACFPGGGSAAMASDILETGIV